MNNGYYSRGKEPCYPSLHYASECLKEMQANLAKNDNIKDELKNLCRCEDTKVFGTYYLEFPHMFKEIGMKWIIDMIGEHAAHFIFTMIVLPAYDAKEWGHSESFFVDTVLRKDKWALVSCMIDTCKELQSTFAQYLQHESVKKRLVKLCMDEELRDSLQALIGTKYINEDDLFSVREYIARIGHEVLLSKYMTVYLFNNSELNLMMETAIIHNQTSMLRRLYGMCHTVVPSKLCALAVKHDVCEDIHHFLLEEMMPSFWRDASAKDLLNHLHDIGMLQCSVEKDVERNDVDSDREP